MATLNTAIAVLCCGKNKTKQKRCAVGCLYGYGEKGELNGVDYYAEHIEDILQMVI